jgi:hypothetical protein
VDLTILTHSSLLVDSFIKTGFTTAEAAGFISTFKSNSVFTLIELFQFPIVIFSIPIVKSNDMFGALHKSTMLAVSMLTEAVSYSFHIWVSTAF